MKEHEHPYWSNEIRHNWGRADGAADAAKGRYNPAGILKKSDKEHFDKHYGEGYKKGHSEYKK